MVRVQQRSVDNGGWTVLSPLLPRLFLIAVTTILPRGGWWLVARATGHDASPGRSPEFACLVTRRRLDVEHTNSVLLLPSPAFHLPTH